MPATLVPGPLQTTLWQAARLPVLANHMVFPTHPQDAVFDARTGRQALIFRLRFPVV